MIVFDSHFDNVFAAVFKQVIGFFNLREGKGMGYQRGCVNLAFRDESTATLFTTTEAILDEN